MELKEVVTDEILKEYKRKGLKSALELGHCYLSQTEKGDDIRNEKAIIKGELAEATLLCQLKELQRVLKFETVIAKGIYVQDTETNKVTELDITFITPYSIYLIECKSYSGNSKEVRGVGELYRNDKLISDVFCQNKLHLTLFNRRYGGNVVKNSRPYRMVVYDYATNKFVDKRELQNKILMPVLNEGTFMAWLSSDLYKSTQKGKIVNIKKFKQDLLRDIQIRDEQLSKEHRRQLRY